MTVIVGLNGHAGVGKDTFAEFLVADHGFTRFAFADRLKQELVDLDPKLSIGTKTNVSLANLVDSLSWDAAKRFAEVREAMQAHGDVRRAEHIDHWVDLLRADITASGATKVVITDVRQDNEADWVESVGTVIRITRPNVGPVNGHHTEVALAGRSFIQVPNRHDLDHLRRMAAAVAGGLL